MRNSPCAAHVQCNLTGPNATLIRDSFCQTPLKVFTGETCHLLNKMSAIIRKIITTAAAPAAIGPYRSEKEQFLCLFYILMHVDVTSPAWLKIVSCWSCLNHVTAHLYLSIMNSSLSVWCLFRGGSLESIDTCSTAAFLSFSLLSW